MPYLSYLVLLFSLLLPISVFCHGGCGTPYMLTKLESHRLLAQTSTSKDAAISLEKTRITNGETR